MELCERKKPLPVTNHANRGTIGVFPQLHALNHEWMFAMSRSCAGIQDLRKNQTQPAKNLRSSWQDDNLSFCFGGKY